MTEQSKERVNNLTGRIVLMLQQRAFTAEETSALIICLQRLLDFQINKHNKNSNKNVKIETNQN